MKSSVKKRSIISYQNLPQEIHDLFNERYASGYSSAIQKITKPSGETIFVVPLETEDSIYMVKVEVKIDAKLSDEEFDKEILAATKSSKEPDFEEEEDEEEAKPSKDKFTLVHGDYSDKELDEDEEEDEEEEEEETV